MPIPSKYSDLVTLEQYRSFSQKMPVVFLACAISIVTQIAFVASYNSTLAGFVWESLLAVVIAILSLVWIRISKDAVTPKQARARMNLTLAVSTLIAFTAFSFDVYATWDAPPDAVAFIAFCDCYLGAIGLVGLINLRWYSVCVIVCGSVAAATMFWRLGAPGGIGSAVVSLEMGGVMIVLMTRYFNDFVRLVRSRAEIEGLMRDAEQAANTDSLTHLPNRRHFFAAAAAFEASARREDRKFALGLIDLDGFKLVNDTYSHRVGDRVLQEVAARFRAALRPSVELCRLGGDEFAILLESDGDCASLTSLGAGLAAALESPIVVGDLKLRVSCTVGFAVYPDMGDSVDALYEHADFAVCDVKRSGKGRTAIFSQEHKARHAAEGAIEQALRDANLEEELYAVFQPIVDSRTGETPCFECLARWNSKTLGPVSPAVFIPIAEHAGLISKLTTVMLRKALDEMKAWPEKLGLSFNLSAYDLNSAGNIAGIIAMVRDSGVSPSRISFEITETALIQDFALAKDNVETLRRCGLTIALDDFGAGYSSLSHVRGLPLGKIKIDQQFIADISSNAGSRVIVKTILALCADLKLDCIVEGVETLEQVVFLNEMGCRLIQGYYYSKPLRAEDVLPYLCRSEPQPAARCA